MTLKTMYIYVRKENNYTTDDQVYIKEFKKKSW